MFKRAFCGLLVFWFAAQLVQAREPYESTYQVRPHPNTLVVNVSVLTGAGEQLDGVDVLVSEGRIAAIGQGLSDDGAMRIDGAGK
ncbi:MAG: hypothetical protein V3R27_02900 [Pseudomonadales bacterium]